MAVETRYHTRFLCPETLLDPFSGQARQLNPVSAGSQKVVGLPLPNHN